MLTVLLPTMTLNQALILLLLLGLTVTSGTATSCIFSQEGPRCVCTIMGLRNPNSLICLEALEMELRDSKLDDFEVDSTLDLTLFFQYIQISKLTLNNVTMPFSFISAVIPFLFSKLNQIDVISSTFEVVQPLQHPELLKESGITALRLEDVKVDPSLLQPSLHALHHLLFGSLKSLHLVRSGLVEIDCNWARMAENLTHLDLSENPISYTSLQSISHCSSLSFKSLNSLHLRHNNLISLQSLCMPLSLTPALTHLDVSGNNFSILDFPHCLQVKTLRMLNLSHSGITEVNLLHSTSLEELDLSYNFLEAFSNPPRTLKKLNLSNNHFIRLLSLDNLSHLRELKVDQLTILIKEMGVSLSTPRQLDSLTTPAAQQGTQIMNLSSEACVKPTSGTQHHNSPLCLTLSVGLLSCLIYFC